MFTTSATRTHATAPADAFAARGIERGGPARLTDHAVAARGIERAQNRPDVVRILDAVEHDDEWGGRSR